MASSSFICEVCMSNLTNNIARIEKIIKKQYPGAPPGPITDLWNMYHEALDHASTPLEFNAIQNWGVGDLVEFIGHQRHNSDDRKQNKSVVDEEVNLYIEAKKLGIQGDTLRRWRRIKPFLEAGLTWKIIAERLALPPETLKDNIKKMRVKGYING
jgi:hypothetical protein